jgi:hypothetical protein
MAYTLPRSLYNILEEVLGSKENELITHDLFEERFKIVDEKFNRLKLKLNIIIILVLLDLVLFN